MSVEIDITLRITDQASAVRVLDALSRAMPHAQLQQRIEESRTEAQVENGSAPDLEPEPSEEDEAVRAAVRSKLIVRLTIGMGEVVAAMAAAGGEADRGTLMSALPERSNNSIGRSLGALERAGLAEPRFEGSSHWKLSALARAAVDGRIPMRVDKRPERGGKGAVEEKAEDKLKDEATPYAALGEGHVGSPEPAAG